MWEEGLRYPVYLEVGRYLVPVLSVSVFSVKPLIQNDLLCHPLMHGIASPLLMSADECDLAAIKYENE